MLDKLNKKTLFFKFDIPNHTLYKFACCLKQKLLNFLFAFSRIFTLFIHMISYKNKIY